MKKCIILAVMAIPLMMACRKSPDLEALKNNQVVVTDRALDANYGTYITYHISDTVGIFASNPNDSILTGATAKALVDVVKANMNSRGYTYVARTANPELGMKLTVVKDVERSTICSGWWGGYWGYWYGYYYPWCGSYTYSVGTSMLTLFDLKNANTNHNLKVIWGMTAFGVFSTANNATNITLTTDAINQAFEQSPYVKR